jgi:alkylation response protein AidB-like acyl-CoA dehydrogenase
MGRLGENHTCAAMVVETIARYGCPSTAMCYTMHLGATTAALFRAHHSSSLQDLLKRLDSDVLIGTLSYSDPETGSHFWYPVSSRAGG